MSGQANMRHRREARRKSAIELQEKRAERTPKQQLKVLDERLGKGVGAARERVQLQILIDNLKVKKEKKNANPSN